MALEEFSNEHDLKIIWRRMTLFAVVAAVGSLAFFLLVKDVKDHYILARLIAGAWFVGPPLWFLYENTQLLKAPDVEVRSKRMARFRLSQDAAKMCWFGIAALMAYLSKAI